MQTHPLNITAAQPAISINIEGRAFRYLEGNSAGNTKIVVKPENGNEMELKPGQGFKLAGEAGRWFVRSFDGTSAITGLLNIGSGDFEDTNVKLDGSVGIAGTPTFNIAAGSKVQEEVLAITKGYVHQNAVTANTPLQIVAPAANVNGILIHRISLKSVALTNDSIAAIIAHTAGPTQFTDGSAIALEIALRTLAADTTARIFDYEMDKTIRIPAGLGLYFLCSTTDPVYKHVLYTLL